MVLSLSLSTDQLASPMQSEVLPLPLSKTRRGLRRLCDGLFTLGGWQSREVRLQGDHELA